MLRSPSLLLIVSSLAVAPILGASSCATGGSHLIATQTRAPGFAAPDQDGKVRTLDEFRGRPLVVFFYPSDGTPGCTTEACAFRDAWARYDEAGIAIVGVSSNDVASHKRFADEHRLPFPLLADTNRAVAIAYGVDEMLGMVDERVTVLIDGDGVVRHTWPHVDPGVHASEILAVALPLATPRASTPPTSVPSPSSAAPSGAPSP